MAVGCNALLTGLYALQIIRDVYFLRLSALICKGCCSFSFIGATLSVSAVWFQMAQKIRAGAGESRKLWMLPGFYVGTIAFFCMAVIILVSGYEQSSSVAGLIAAIICIGFISYTFRVAGRQVVAVLSFEYSDGREGNRGALSNAAQQTQIIAIKVRETASFMSRAFAILGVVLLWLALSIPSQKPVYPGQNDLPRLYSGQAAVTAVRNSAYDFCMRMLYYAMTVLVFVILLLLFSSFFFSLHTPSQARAGMLYVGSCIVQYVKFWDERRAVTQRRATACVVPEEIEDSSRGRGGLVLLTAEGLPIRSNGNVETRLQQPNPRKPSLSAIEEVSSSEVTSSEGSSGMLALSLAFQLQTSE
jgi:hypothetical protein